MCTLWHVRCVLHLCVSAGQNGNGKYDFDLYCIVLISSCFVTSVAIRSVGEGEASRH